MLFEYEVAIPANTLANAPVVQTLKLTKGIIHKIEITGDGGEHSLVKVALTEDGHQAFPTNPDGQFHPHWFPIAYDVYHPLQEAPYQLKARAWSPGTTYDHSCIVRIGIERWHLLELARDVLSVINKLKSVFFGSKG